MSSKKQQVRPNEKYVLTARELHLGYIKETFRAGAVIELDEVHRCIIIDGRKFSDTRDLDVLRRQADRDPENAWIVKYSREIVEEIKSSLTPKVQAKKVSPGQKMQVVQSDEDLMDKDIDIRDTQISKKTQAAKEAARNRPKDSKLEIIRGDETVEERLASLKGKTDINSMAERVRLKSTGAAKMEVVKDDSLGSAAGSASMALNAGQSLPSRAVVEARTADAKAKADARKKDAEARRASMDMGDAELAESTGSETAPQPKSKAEKENEELRKKIAQLEAKQVKTAKKPGRPAKKVVPVAAPVAAPEAKVEAQG